MIETKLFGYDLKNFGKASNDLFGFIKDALIEFLPKRISDKLRVGQEMINVFITDKKYVVSDTALGNTQILREFDRDLDRLDDEIINFVKSHLDDDKELVLTIADKLALIRDIQLPITVKDNLSQVVFYEMEKYTPFDKNSIYYDVMQTGIVGNNLVAKLAIVHQDLLTDIISNFGANGLKFNRVNVDSLDNVNLLPVNLRNSNKFVFSKNIKLGLATIILFALCLSTPLLFKRYEAIKLNSEIGAIEAKAAGETDLWVKLHDREDIISGFIKSRPLPFGTVLEEITKILPDNTWVSEMVYTSGKLSIKGSSKDPAGLVNKLEASPILSNVVFEGPIVRDTFRLGMTIATDDKTIDELSKNKVPK